MKARILLGGLFFAATLALASDNAAHAQVNKSGAGGLAPPSNGSFLVPIINHLKLPAKYGLEFDINLYSSPATLYSDYAAGRTNHIFGALYNGANFYNRGVPTKLLFTVSTANHAFVSKHDAIKNPTDLTGKTIAATTSSGFYGMAVLYLKQNNLDPRQNIQILEGNPSAVQTFLLASRADAGLLAEPGLSNMLTKGFHMVGDMNASIRKALKMKNDAAVWYIGCFASAEWVEKNPDKVLATYKMWREAADFYRDRPDEADKIISEFTKLPLASLQKSRALGLSDFRVEPAIDEKESLTALFGGFVEAGFLSKIPDDGVYYQWPKKP